VNSFLYCANALILGIVWLTTTSVLFENDNMIFQLMMSYEFVFYFAYVFNYLTSLFYTFGGIMDIYIAYTRVQAFKPEYTFLKTVSIRRCSLLIVIFSFLIPLPINISREVLTYEFKLNATNTSLVLYTYSKLLKKIFIILSHRVTYLLVAIDDNLITKSIKHLMFILHS